MFKSSSPNFYQVLQVSPNASVEVIEAVYRSLARTYHPDLNHDTDTTEQMQAINVAYSVLTDPDKRRAYDLSLNPPDETPVSKWSQTTWPTRISYICILLSIVSLIGILQNLVNHRGVTLNLLRNSVVMEEPGKSDTAAIVIPDVAVSSDSALVAGSLSEEQPSSSLTESNIPVAPSLDDNDAESQTTGQILADASASNLNVNPNASLDSTPAALALANPLADRLAETQPPADAIAAPTSAEPDFETELANDAPDVQRSGLQEKSKTPANDIRPILPFPGAEVGGLQTFEWFVVTPQVPDLFVELVFWKDGEDPFTDGFGIAAPTRASSLEVNLDEVDGALQSLLEPGDYLWGLMGVEVVPEYRRVRMLSAGQRVRFNNYGLAKQPEHQATAPEPGE